MRKDTLGRFSFLFWAGIILSSGTLSAQRKIVDETFERWITENGQKCNEVKYYLLLNANEICQACHQRHLESILANRLTGKIRIVTYKDVFRLTDKDTSPLDCIVKARADFRKLGDLQYRNALIKFEQGDLYLLTKLNPYNMDSVLMYLK